MRRSVPDYATLTPSNKLGNRRHMAEELTSLQIIDSAVKIGLGALITAVSGYLVLKRTQQGQVEAEYREEKRRSISELTEAVGHISHRALDFWSYINDREINKALGVQIPKEIEEKLNDSQRQFHASFEKLTRIEGKYFIIAGEKKYKQLEEYGSLLAQFHVEGAFGVVRDLSTWPSREKTLREALLASIKEVYEQELS